MNNIRKEYVFILYLFGAYKNTPYICNKDKKVFY